jgi:SAM-dependent methyltransferase
MTKSDLLTEEEFKTYKPQEKTIVQLNAFMASKGCTEKEIKVLDWGCGRGRFVLWLREQGFDTYGVDIESLPVENGSNLLKEKGYNDNLLSLIDASGRTNFPDGFFDFVISENVLEHVRDLKVVTDEISRITVANGSGYHIFPAHRQFIEGHLFMPFIHWIPRGNIRKSLIRLFVRLGREPKWKELDHFNINEKVETYYKYSTDKIFYRHYAMVENQFEQSGLVVNFQTINNPLVNRHKIFGPLSRNRLTRPFINLMLLTFKQVEIVVKKYQ